MEMANSVERGIDKIAAVRELPQEDLLDLQGCVEQLRTNKPPRFSWDCSLYTNPPQRPPEARTLESTETEEVTIVAPEDQPECKATDEGKDLKDSSAILLRIESNHILPARNGFVEARSSDQGIPEHS